MWLEELVGFDEHRVDDVAGQFLIDEEFITSQANGRTMQCGTFDTPSLGELRDEVDRLRAIPGPLTVREVVADVQELHLDPANAGATFQVASQFNTLEMPEPAVTPEDGIGGYQFDGTQGPACAIACGAGTIYRNYLVEVEGQQGQSASIQIDCLADLATALGIDIEMQNGYAFPTAAQLDRVRELLAGADRDERDELASMLCVGLQAETEVTLNHAGHLVTQVYCSALPVAYSSVPAERWEPFARLVLDAAYEATLAAAAINTHTTGNRQVYLTLLGGGVFGNEPSWIIDAVERALGLHADLGLEVAIVSHGGANPHLAPLLTG